MVGCLIWGAVISLIGVLFAPKFLKVLAILAFVACTSALGVYYIVRRLIGRDR
ncbi:MAG: hypothetical protein RMM29_08880 [Planctomycetota bacterium]|nr:hypothetical protein [Planctomycetota bacterium]MCX8040364.1 hypothetical protein [Planctomycetota bacterium]MDW8373740.1 hypothetical protein [Planctomycetota bacterium]